MARPATRVRSQSVARVVRSITARPCGSRTNSAARLLPTPKKAERTAFHDLRSLVLLAPRTDLAEPIHGTDRNGQGKGEHARRWNEEGGPRRIFPAGPGHDLRSPGRERHLLEILFSRHPAKLGAPPPTPAAQ